MRRSFFFAICCLLFWPAAGLAKYAPGQIIIKFQPGVVELAQGLKAAQITAAKIKISSIQALNTKHQVYKIERLYEQALINRPDWKQLKDVYVIYFPVRDSVDKIIQDYQKNASVISAQPDSIVKAFTTTPNDPRFPNQYGLIKAQIPQAWDRSTGETSVVVAVLDTGIYAGHEDFAGRLDPRGKDFVHNDNDPADDFGHGTVVSGVIGAATNNGLGVAGVDWSAKILPVKVLNNIGEGKMSDILAGLAYANSLSVEVINMSFGQYATDASLQERCEEAYQNGVVLVAAAGNDNTENRSYPAALPHVIGVAAVDRNDQRSVWNSTQASNYGSWVSVAAAGSSIWSTYFQGGYRGDNDGTSFAAPYVAGLASLLKAAYPTLTNQQIMTMIINSADNINALNPDYVGKLGSGRINAYSAISGVSSLLISPTTNEYLAGLVNIIGTAAGRDFSRYQLELYQNNVLQVTLEASSFSVEAGLLGTWNTNNQSDGQYQIKLKVLSANLLSAEAQITVNVDNTTPEVGFTSPSAGATVEGQITITGTAEEQQLDYYLLEYGAGARPGGFVQVAKGYASVSNGALGTWETAGLQGTYTLQLTAKNKAGLTATQRQTINIQAIPPTKEVEPQPGLVLTYALPNPFNRASTAETTLNYTLAGNFNTKIYLFDLTGTLLWQQSYLAGANGGKSGANNPPWDGRDQFGATAPAGLYLYQVTADGRIIARGKTIILN